MVALLGVCPVLKADIAINPVTNKIYAANETLPYLNVIDGTTHELKSIDIGCTPGAIEVNAATNKIYILCGKASLAVVDGATDDVIKVAIPAGPRSLAINRLTNEVYVTDYYAGKVTIIDGATNRTDSVKVGPHPTSVAVNEETNKIYIGKWESGELTILDGASKQILKVAIAGASEGQSIVVNAQTNKIYAGSYGQSKKITVIDGFTNQTTEIQTAGFVFDVAANPGTNKIYVTNSYIGKISVIDGVNGNLSIIAAGHFPTSIAINSATNRIYAANGDPCGGVAVIDGDSGKVTARIKAGIELSRVIVDAKANRIYAYDAETLTFIDGATNKTTSVVLPIPTGMSRYTASETCRYSNPR